ncbi:heparan sulfate glucosamine 3-O-sulfotransferase 1-like [Ptychodera flava]|uniref:heparan sulfate glucosamine 3-O-sulfotransferase 1-like n=1 Tax=Ptychodera flava TaxID=63121 RepID=UPI00396AA4CF
MTCVPWCTAGYGIETMTIKTKFFVVCVVASLFVLALVGNVLYHTNQDILCFMRPKPLTAYQTRDGLTGVLDLEDDDSMDFFHAKGMKRRLPQAIIIGVRKCGTRALLAMLKLHPKIQAASAEIHFFDRDENYSRGLDWYRRHMPYSYPDQISMEKSPAYFITDDVPERIYKMDPSVKLLLIVRDPATRVLSDYTQTHTNKVERKKPHESFEELVLDGSRINTKYKAVRTSMYSKHLVRWYSRFPKQQIHIVDGDKLIRDPVPQLQEVEDFLGLEHKISYSNFYFNETRGFYCMKDERTNKCLSDSKGRKHPDVEPRVMQKLQEFYQPFNEKFEEMTGKKFDWP